MTTTYQTISAEKARKMMSRGGALLIDVRLPEEFEDFHITGALNLPLFELLENIGRYTTGPDHAIILYCKTGRSSRNAAKALVYIGYGSVYDMGEEAAGYFNTSI